jgi:hypothetical protein
MLVCNENSNSSVSVNSFENYTDDIYLSAENEKDELHMSANESTKDEDKLMVTDKHVQNHGTGSDEDCDLTEDKDDCEDDSINSVDRNDDDLQEDDANVVNEFDCENIMKKDEVIDSLDDDKQKMGSQDLGSDDGKDCDEDDCDCDVDEYDGDCDEFDCDENEYDGDCDENEYDCDEDEVYVNGDDDKDNDNDDEFDTMRSEEKYSDEDNCMGYENVKNVEKEGELCYEERERDGELIDVITISDDEMSDHDSRSDSNASTSSNQEEIDQLNTSSFDASSSSIENQTDEEYENVLQRPDRDISTKYEVYTVTVTKRINFREGEEIYNFSKVEQEYYEYFEYNK